MRSLTETDPEVRSTFAPAVGSASLSGLYGPPLTGGDYSSHDARAVCDRLQRTTRLRPDFLQVIRELSATSWILDTLPYPEFSRVLVAVQRVEKLSDAAMRPGADLPAIRAGLRAARESFEALVSELCADPVPRSRTAFCELRGARARAVIDVRQALAEGVAPGDFDLFTRPPVQVPARTNNRP
jgi:hypothetical protein